MLPARPAQEERALPSHRRFLIAEEGGIFLLGCVLLIAWVIFIAVMWRIEHPYWGPMLGMGFTQMLAGRAASIAQAMTTDLPRGLTLGLATFFDTVAALIYYPILVFSYRNLVERRFFQNRMEQIFESARKGAERFRKYKILGVFAFVWLPLWMTGPLVGAIAGYLLGLRGWVSMLTVTLSTFCACATWVYAYDQLFGLVGDVHGLMPVIVTAVIIAVLAGMRIRAGLKAAKKRKRRNDG